MGTKVGHELALRQPGCGVLESRHSPFKHGDVLHSLMSSLHLTPWKPEPEGQRHRAFVVLLKAVACESSVWGDFSPLSSCPCWTGCS